MPSSPTSRVTAAAGTCPLASHSRAADGFMEAAAHTWGCSAAASPLRAAFQSSASHRSTIRVDSASAAMDAVGNAFTSAGCALKSTTSLSALVFHALLRYLSCLPTVAASLKCFTAASAHWWPDAAASTRVDKAY